MDQVEMYETPPSPELHPLVLPRRRTRLPARYHDVLPPPAPAVIHPIAAGSLGHSDVHSATTLPPSVMYTSPANSYGIHRVYKCGAPSYTPDNDFNLESVADNPNFTHVSQASSSRTAPSLAPFDINPISVSSSSSVNPVSSQRFENPSIFRLMLWYHNGSLTKSLNDLNVLVRNVIQAPDFHVQHFDNFDTTKAVKKLFEQGDTSETLLNDGWYETAVPISLACDRVTHNSQ
ncbi:hypothetical protein H4582DRAFT_2085063 [Lactarius indigo]|nr:hypothetical protein H4582DRAFT_2085063 [Lactarius indigo]